MPWSGKTETFSDRKHTADRRAVSNWLEMHELTCYVNLPVCGIDFCLLLSWEPLTHKPHVILSNLHSRSSRPEFHSLIEAHQWCNPNATPRVWTLPLEPESSCVFPSHYQLLFRLIRIAETIFFLHATYRPIHVTLAHSTKWQWQWRSSSVLDPWNLKTITFCRRIWWKRFPV